MKFAMNNFFHMTFCVNFTQEMVSESQHLCETSFEKDSCAENVLFLKFDEITEIIELIRLIIITLIKWVSDFDAIFSNSYRGKQVVEGKLQ